MERLGYAATGWDPTHRPDTPHVAADVVNLGYVVNVIENPSERKATLSNAWRLTRQLLIVSARLYGDRDRAGATTFGDGCLTQRGTFQKFYSQVELRDWINETLKEQSVAAAPGVFFVFRDEGIRQRFLASRFRQIRAVPTVRISDVLYEKHKDLLRPLIEFVTERGRLPETRELETASKLESLFGSIRKAFSVIRQVTGPDQWELIRKGREQELLIHLALDRFRRRARFTELPTDMQLDIRDFFSTYSRACEMADELLFSAGNLKELNRAMQKSTTGKLTAEALYVHVDAIPRLDTCLRIYEGCARGYLGVVEGANIVKLHRMEPMVSYLSYPDFDTIPHPALMGSLSLKLSKASVRYLDYSSSENPPILHRKEEFLAPDDPRREKFSRLTRQEEKRGLFEDTTIIGTRRVWEQVLTAHGVELHGHRLTRAR